MNAILAFVEVLDMQFDYLANGSVEHEEAWSLFDSVGWFGYIDHVKNRS